MTTKLSPNDIPCKFYYDWWEDVVGDGGPRMQFSDCNCNKEFTPDQQLAMDAQKDCSPQCPGYEPVEIFVCKKHDCEFVGICSKCESEYLQREVEVERQYEINKEEL